MISKIQGAKRLANFDKPTVWSIMTPLAIKTKSVNLVHTKYTDNRVKDFHHGHLLNFILNILKNHKKKVCCRFMKGYHQYVRAFGSLPFVNAIAKFHKRFPKIDP